MRKKKALFLGRFQPPSIAHLETVRTILKQWDNLTIAVVYNSPRPKNVDPRWVRPLEIEDASSYSQPKNPFSSTEVGLMWEECLKVAGVTSRVMVTETLRPQFYPFNERFPPEGFNWVSITPNEKNNNSLDRLQMYEELFGRKIWLVKPEFELHNTEIKKIVSLGRSWKEFIPAGAFEIFIEVDGPSRITATIS